MNNLPFVIENRLPEDMRPVIKKLADQGWEFRSGYWESHHNGDPYDDVDFKSPNMKEFKSIGEYEWNERLTLTYLLEKEAQAVAKEWVEDACDYHFIETPLSEALSEHLAKRKDTTFKLIPYDATKFVVKVSPKNLQKPKHIKVTIEIT